MNKERELLGALAQMMVNKFHADYPDGTQPGDATRLAMGYLNLLHETQRPEVESVKGSDSYDWKSAALRLGEQLADTGPDGYYQMTPTQWLDWCERNFLRRKA